MRIENCVTCRFYVEHTEDLGWTHCHREPPQVYSATHEQFIDRPEYRRVTSATGAEFPRVQANWWCGEWKPDPDRTCGVAGETILEARKETPEYRDKNGRVLIPSFPARSAVYRKCLLPPKHDGDHSDGGRTWAP